MFLKLTITCLNPQNFTPTPKFLLLKKKKRSLYVCSQLSHSTNMMFNPTPLKQWFKVQGLEYRELQPKLYGGGSHKVERLTYLQWFKVQGLEYREPQPKLYGGGSHEVERLTYLQFAYSANVFSLPLSIFNCYFYHIFAIEFQQKVKSFHSIHAKKNPFNHASFCLASK